VVSNQSTDAYCRAQNTGGSTDHPTIPGRNLPDLVQNLPLPCLNIRQLFPKAYNIGAGARYTLNVYAARCILVFEVLRVSSKCRFRNRLPLRAEPRRIAQNITVPNRPEPTPELTLNQQRKFL